MQHETRLNIIRLKLMLWEEYLTTFSKGFSHSSLANEMLTASLSRGLRLVPKELIVILVLISTSVAEKVCYHPNGKVAEQTVPCYKTAGESFCCPFGHVCLSTKLCVNTLDLPTSIGRVIRGSCTDRSWKSKECPMFCNADCKSPGPTLLCILQQAYR